MVEPVVCFECAHDGEGKNTAGERPAVVVRTAVVVDITDVHKLVYTLYIIIYI